MNRTAATPERHSMVALAWTRAAIDECLADARQALERFASEPGEATALTVFVDNLHQVQGCLRMLELRGAARLAEELELLGRALADGHGARGECLGALWRGIAQLPVYLERLRSARHDLPLVVLPLLNQLRGCRGAEPLDQDSLQAGADAGSRPTDADLAYADWPEQLHEDGHGRDALRSVVMALCDDLVRIRERLDQAARGECRQEQLDTLLAPLRQVADTLAVLGFRQPRRVILDQVLALQGLSREAQPMNAALLMDMAGALSYVEASLNGMVGPLEDPGQASLSATDLAEIRQVVLEQALAVLRQAKDLIGDCIESGWSRQRLQALPGLFQQMRGALQMLMLPRSGDLASGCAGYLESWLRQPERDPSSDELDALARALSAMECDLQWRIADPQADTEPFQEQARASLRSLGVQCPSPTEDSLPTPAEPGVDDELRRVFLEEARQLLEQLERHWLRWCADNSQRSALEALRRVLHTLKGSGRMAHAQVVAELAWGAEHLLNRVLEDRASLDAQAQVMLQQALARLPVLLGDFADGRLPALAEVERLAEHLHGLANRDTASHAEAGGPDLRLLEIFRGEAQGHLTVLEQFLEAAGGQATPVSDELQRALHTLKGSAAMAGVLPIAELATALDRLAREYKAHQLPLETGDLQRLGAASALLRGAVAQLGRPLAVIAGANVLIEALGAAVDARLLALADEDGQARRTRRDPQLIAGFLAQGMDILLDAESLLSRWQEHPRERQELDALLAELTSLGHAAHLAELWQIDDVCEALLDLYGAVEEGSLAVDAGFFRQAQQAHEALIDMLDELAAGQGVTSRPQVVSALRGLLGEALAPSSLGVLSQRDGVVDLDEALRPEQSTPPRPAESDRLAACEGVRGDKELLEVFLDESSDLVENASESLVRWQAEPRNTVEVENLLRDLHTLKGNARMVQVGAIGDLAHELEFLYELLAAGHLPPGPALFGLLQNCHDRLAHMLDAIRLGQPLHAATALIDYIRNFSSAALTDSAAGQGKPEADLSEAVVAAPDRSAGDMVKVAAELLDDLGNLASEHSIIRGRVEQHVNDAQFALSEMETTLERMRDQLLRLDTETQGRSFGRQPAEGDDYDDFDPLEMDRHSQLQQLSRALFESASDLLELKETLCQKSREAQALLQQQARVNGRLQEGLLGTRMVPFERLVPRLQRVVRQVASELGKQVELMVENAEGELDRSVLERMVAPLEHMLRNAVDHGLETREARLAAGKPEHGTILLNLLHEGSDIVIEMSDDGAGVPLEAVRRKAIKRGLLDPGAQLSDHEVMQFILRPGFSTAEKITQISGRGLGMDVVHEEVKQLGGSMSIASSAGKGARFSIRLPLAVSVNRALMVNLGEEQYAVALDSIEGIVRVPPTELQLCYQQDPPRYRYAGREYQLYYLGDLLQGSSQPQLLGQSVPLPVLLVESSQRSFAIQVDSLSPSREIVVKSLGPQLAAVPGLAGATLLGDGRVVLILDLLGQLRGRQRSLARPPIAPRQGFGPTPRPLLVMVVDDSVTVRKVTGRLLERHGMNVITAKDGVDAMGLLEEHRPDLLLLDIEMPRMDGFEVAMRMRADERFKNVPIIMITSRTGQKHRDRAMAIGVNDYLGKPYQESLLLQSIARWSERHA
ncbi:Hpt domain-containing protein [Pseudomonas fulva]|nr:Hpt domain-containing protein [Pseudomonas fulva]MBF8778869.1 Hpt domain-containing protein [Pseudomonas fulva]